MTSRASVSVVVNTNARRSSLAETLRSFRYLDYPDFEVVVVLGPDDRSVKDAWVHDAFPGAHVARCDERNLSASRNVGIREAAGDLVAFIDDDAIPDPLWLHHMELGFCSDEVAAVGGPVYDHTGAEYQFRFVAVTRLGEVVPVDGVNPTNLLNAPGTGAFVSTVGTNSCFRREALVALGGFDEVFAYYFDETDVCLRLTDAGLVVRALEHGSVYHRFLPSDRRGADRFARDRFMIVRSLVYFALRHGPKETSFAAVCQAIAKQISFHRWDMQAALSEGRIAQWELDRFEDHVAAASDEAFALVAEPPRVRDPAWFDGDPRAWSPSNASVVAPDPLHVCLLSGEWGPGPINGIARVLTTLANGLARQGHHVHVIVPGGRGHSRVDPEDGVWVHRIGLGDREPAWTPGTFSTAALREVDRIDAERAVDVVQAPNWDAIGYDVLRSRRYATVLGLYTPLKVVIETEPWLSAEDPDLRRLVERETECIAEAGRILACGPAIVTLVEEEYGIAFAEGTVVHVAHGLDEIEPPASLRTAASADEIWILFVGRLEARKGIDVFLATLPGLLDRHPNVRVRIAGDDSIPGPDGCTYRDAFEASEVSRTREGRVQFLGRVDDQELRSEYASCDIFVAPSRFESFGLIAVEAMMLSKPVVASAIGGLTEIIDDDVTGILVTPGSPPELEAAIERLIGDSALRARMGAAGRATYVERYSSTRMVREIAAVYRSFAGQFRSDRRPGGGDG